MEFTFIPLGRLSSGSILLTKDQEVALFLRKTDNNTFIPINENDSVFVSDLGKFTNISTKEELERNKIK